MSNIEDDDVIPPPPPPEEEDERNDENLNKDTTDENKKDDQEGSDPGDDGENDEEDQGDEQDDDNEDEEDKEESAEEDEDDEIVRNLSTKQKRKRTEKTKKKSKRRGVSGFKFFSDEADEDDMGDDEDEEYDQTGGSEQILDKDEQAAIAAVEKRHKANREYLDKSADELAADFERRAQQEKRMKAKFEAGDGIVGSTGSIQQTLLEQQSLLPSVMDPKIFQLKCKVGNELMLVRAVMLKAIDIRNKGGLLKIKSAFCSSVRGMIYIEALSEAFVKEIIQGLRMIYGSSFSQVPVSEMTSVLTATVKKKPLKEGQWIRLKRGPLKGDLGRILGLYEGGSKAFIQAIPRPDYATSAAIEKDGKSFSSKKNNGGIYKVRPQQRLFDPEEARLAGAAFVYRRHHPMDLSSTMYDVWENDYYKNGFLYKEVNVDTYLETVDIKPRLEELQLFRQMNNKNHDNIDEDDEDEHQHSDDDNNTNHHNNFLKELAEQIDYLDDKDSKDNNNHSNIFLPGDLIQVTNGELKNLIARIISINDATKIAKIIPYNNNLTTEISIEVDNIIKYIFPGAHIKVVNGRYMGQTGRVVSVKMIDNSNIAIILTDGINTEIQCNVAHLQMSSEVTTGYGNLMGYELYDIVALSENECAVIIVVGTEKLRIINHMGNVRDVLPQELLGKRNTFSLRSTGFDIQHNLISIGDTVKVTTGFHAKLNGTVKHMMKGTLWLHSNSYLKNSGIFVVKTRNCVVAGGKTTIPTMSQGYKGVLLPPTQQQGSNSMSVQGVTGVGASALARGNASGNNRNGGGPGKDWMVGKTVRITKGGFKGLLAQVVDATPTHYSVELLAKMKKIVVERNNTVLVGDEKGSLEKTTKTSTDTGYVGDTSMFDISQTPRFTSQTPIHNMGSATPHGILGSETPMLLYGDATPSSRTPRATDESNAIWGINEYDRQLHDNSVTTSMQNTPGQSIYSDTSSRRGGSGWGSDAPSISNYSPANTDNSNYSNNHGGYYPNNSGMSSMVGSGANTPLSMVSNMAEMDSIRSGAPSSVGSSMRGGNAAAVEVSFRNWGESMVMLVKRGEHVGKWAVIQQRPDEAGNVQLSLRDKNGGLQGGFCMHYTDLDLAVPAKRERVMVLTGKDQYKTGVVSTVQRNDIVVALDDRPNDPQIYRSNRLAWLNTKH